MYLRYLTIKVNLYETSTSKQSICGCHLQSNILPELKLIIKEQLFIPYIYMNNIDIFLYYCLKTEHKRWPVSTIPFLLSPVPFCEKGGLF